MAAMMTLAYLDAIIEKQEAICSLILPVAEARIILEERLATSSKSIRMKLDDSDDA